MKTKNLLIVLFLWNGLFNVNADPSHTSYIKPEVSHTIIKDSLAQKENDTIKTNKPLPFLGRPVPPGTGGEYAESHLSHLQKLTVFKSSVLDGSRRIPPPQLPVIAGRSFPTLDKKLANNKDFAVSFANRKPEFTQAYITRNFQVDPQVDEFIKQAEAAFNALDSLNNFVDIITGKELLELPVGLHKRDSTSGNSVELAITEVKFTSRYAEFKAWAKMSIPVKDTYGKPNRELYFGVEGVKLSHDGALIDGMKLVLLGDQPIPLNGDNWLLTLKGGVNLKTGTFDDRSYVEFDCAGLKGIGLEADLRISRNVLLPITSGGNYVCGDSPDSKYFKDSDVVNNKCYVGTSFSVKANGWNDLLVEVSLPQFEVRGLKGWGFNVKRAVLDLSDTRNAIGIKFPKDYSEVLVRGERNLWRGFYAKEISLILPKGIENTKTSNKRVQFGAKDLILDSQGVSGTFFNEYILKKGEGSAGKWAFTITDISISLSRNSLIGGKIGGDIAVPIFEKPMDYIGYIQQDGYGLEVGLNSTYKTPFFLGEMQLDRNSSVAIDVQEEHVYPSANLTGQLSIVGKIGQKEGEEQSTTEDAKNNGKVFSFPGIEFEGLKLETEPGKKPISAKNFGFTGEMKLMNFPVSVEDLKLVAQENQVGLSFGLKINLDGEGSHATTNMEILGKLQEDAKIQEWKFERVKIDGLEIDYEKSGIALKGALEVMEDHSWYGDGFRGKVTATIKSIDVKVEGKAIFGAKDFRYWNVDVWSKNNEKSDSKFLINSFVGGVSYHMKKSRGNKDGFSPSSAVYRPNLDYGLGVRAGVNISTKNSGTFSGKAYLEMEFNGHGGLNRIGFTGEGALMGNNTSSGLDPSDFGALNTTLEKINNFVEDHKETADQLSKYGNFLGLSKEAVPLHDVAASGKIGVFIGIEKDFANQTFDGEFELYMDLEGVKGGGQNNLAGYAKIHTGPDDWYIYIGTPQKRIELLFQVGVQLRVGGYFMTGTKLPSQLDPHPLVVKILGDDMLNGNRKENQLESGKGFAFGLNFGYGYNFDYLIFYAYVELGAGFDVMHAYYPDAKCVGRPGPVGNNGWYSMGQVYAYLYGEFGVKVDLAFIKGNFPIAEAGVAAMLRGQFPNPVYFQGYVGMYYKILGGLISGRMRLKVQMGEECELENISNAVGVPMISDITPRDKSDNVSVFATPQAVFNYSANSDFTVELENGVKTFKLQLKSFTATSEGKKLKGTLEWNENNDIVTFKPAESLPSEKEVKVAVEVSFDEKVGGSYQTVITNGKPTTEKMEITFVTDKAPDHIPFENIAYMYPVLDQQNFYPKEYKKGYVKLVTPQNYLFDGGYEMRAEFVSTTSGQGERTDLSYNRSKAMVFYDLPDMDPSTTYSLNLIAFPPGAEIRNKVIIENTEILTDAKAGDTNWFNIETGSQETKSISGSAVVANKKAGIVSISNGAPKSILEYKFKTSSHNSFKEKIKNLDITDNLTNYIYADVHSLSLKVADYEYLDELEVQGGKYTGSKPLVYAQAVMDDPYYKRKIYPLLYENYPLDGDIRVDREEEILGVPPIRSFYVGNEYLANLNNNPRSPWVKNRIPFVFNLPYQYKLDMVYLRNKIVNRYGNSEGNKELFDQYRYLLESSFPPLPFGTFKTKLIYRTPGALYEKGYQIKYKND